MSRKNEPRLSTTPSHAIQLLHRILPVAKLLFISLSIPVAQCSFLRRGNPNLRNPKITANMPLSSQTQSPNFTKQYSYIDQEEFRQLTVNCPNLYKDVDKMCRKQSCDGRCRDMLESDEVCSCDKKCKVYQDCCWDFHSQCPEEEAASHQLLYVYGQVETSCLDNMHVISGCKNRNETTSTETTIEWDLTIRDSLGFSFATRHGYNCVHGQNGSTIQNTFGPKTIYIPLNKTVDVIKNYILTGKRSHEFIVKDGTRMFTKNRIRMCRPSFKIVCAPGPSRNNSCKILTPIYIRNHYELCNNTLSNRGVNIFGGINPKTALSFSASKWNGKSPLKGENKNETEDGECDIKTEYFVKQKIDLSKYYTLVSNLHEVNKPGFMVWFNAKEHSLNRYLKTVQCNKRIESGCFLSVECKKGYIPVQFVCRQALRVVVQVYGKSKFNELKRVLDTVFSVLVTKFREILDIPPNWTPKIKVRRRLVFTSVTDYLKMKEYNLPYNDQILPVTGRVIEMLNTHNASDIVNKVTICFYIPELNHLGKTLLCDFLSSNSSNLTLEKHVLLHSHRMPDPFLAHGNRPEMQQFSKGHLVIYGIKINLLLSFYSLFELFLYWS